MFNFEKNSFKFGYKNSETLEHVKFEREVVKQILTFVIFQRKQDKKYCLKEKNSF